MSFAPVNAMSGSTPLRLGSMLSVGSPVADEPPFFSSRSRPTCCQQNAATEAASDGLKPLQACFSAACLTPLETKIWSWLPDPLTLPSSSSQATHGTGSLPATAAPPATEGFSASLSVLMFSDGMPAPRSWPSGCQRFSGRDEAAGEDLLLATERSARLVPRVPRDGAARAREVDRRRLGLDVLIDVERRPLRHPLAVLERAHEDPLRAAGLLLERRPRHARAAGCKRSADDVGDTGVLVGVDPVRRVVVDLRPVRRQPDDRPGRAPRERAFPRCSRRSRV